MTRNGSNSPPRGEGGAVTNSSEDQTGEAPCRACEGTGQLDGSPCPNCNGTGKVLAIVGDA